MGLLWRFDLALLASINGFARRNPVFDRFVVMLEGNSLLKIGLLVGLLWFAWFSAPAQSETRRRVALTVLTACVAVLVARLGQRFLPERPRPIHDPGVQARLPFHLEPTSHQDMSSFPSDHAVLLCALATGLWLISRRYGILAFVLTAVDLVVRVYSGLHYPSDVLGGALLGIVIMGIAWRSRRLAPRVVDAALRTEALRPGAFYTVAFLLSWQIAEMFGDCRFLAFTLWSMAKEL
ncbi:MAG TPA: phosphatase PAP2 family protein [Candidatus Polarisedimenticolia bacterium]|nr:phosphatase PAP2 family protein [Candidatus Polarisedimenticolia bacterium]